LGATTSMFQFDGHIAEYLEATGRAELARLAERNQDLLSLDPEVLDDPEKYFDRVVRLDLKHA
jgi:aconitate hydratase